jgi:trans-2,3-dihydro-3-hydroxyanthranilate isomerase
MPTLHYLHYDVFTSRPFEGNQLAVFEDARGVSGADMQRLTNEMNFAESTFVLPAETPGTDIRMRIFTPAREMPMAGHPTVGTTFALADSGVIARGRARWVFGLNIGPVPVALDWQDGTLRTAWMDQGQPEFRPPASPVEHVLDAVHADRAAWTATGRPVEEGSCGAAFYYVPLATRAAVDACEPDGGAMRRLQSAFAGAHVGVFVFSAEPGDDGATVYCRMFAPEAGVVEDPATGSAHGPLGAYLVRHGVVPLDHASAIVSAQGVKMGRPSRLQVRVEASSVTDVTRVHVGGAAVKVGEGTLTW